MRILQLHLCAAGRFNCVTSCGQSVIFAAGMKHLNNLINRIRDSGSPQKRRLEMYMDVIGKLKTGLQQPPFWRSNRVNDFWFCSY